MSHSSSETFPACKTAYFGPISQLAANAVSPLGTLQMRPNHEQIMLPERRATVNCSVGLLPSGKCQKLTSSLQNSRFGNNL
jgi:hypothetical protein